MAWEQLVEVPAPLREGHILHFVGGWSGLGNSIVKDDQWYKVERAQQIKYDVAKAIASASSFDIDFRTPAGGGVSDPSISLLPDKADSIYELLMGIKGNVLVYPMYGNTYYLKLEATSVIPTTTDARLRYLGFWDEDDSPFDKPKLREHVVNGQEPPMLRLYNDQFIDERVVLRFIVNRCKIVQVTPANLSEDLRRLARVVKYHGWFNY